MNNLEKWQSILENGDLHSLKSLLSKDVTFYSPILFKPQHGRKLTSIYLSAAFKVLTPRGFRYTKILDSDDHSILEFECELDSVKVNGVDIISWNGDGQITAFKVMLRPFRAIEKVGELMKKELNAMSLLDKARLKFS